MDIRKRGLKNRFLENNKTEQIMKQVEVFFEQDPSVESIEVRIRAAQKDEEVTDLIRRISEKPKEKLTVQDSDGTLLKIDTEEIISVSVNGKYTEIVTENDRYLVRQPLHLFEERLNEDRFVRISRYEIVNLRKVLRYDFTLGGTLRLELQGGTETWASRRNIPSIRKKLTEGA